MKYWVYFVPDLNAIFEWNTPFSVLPVINETWFKNITIMLWFQKNFFSFFFSCCVSVNKWWMSNCWQVKNLFFLFNSIQNAGQSISVHGFISSWSSWFLFPHNCGVNESSNSMNDNICIVDLLFKFLWIENASY